MNSRAFGLSALLARLALALLAAAGLASCGSGAVSGPPVTVTPGPITILPATATLYSSLPTTFVVSGGNGNYIVTSSDQSAVPPIATFTGSTFIVIPNAVAADTPVTLTVRDTGTTTPITAALIVKPRTVSNVVTITPSPSQPAVCGTALCSGGDAEVKATLAQNGVPITGHEVRFEVISGSFRIITSAPGTTETTSLSGTTFTDASGTARMRIRASVDAAPQTALIQITDVSSGAFQRTSFVIAQATGSSAGFFATPSSVTFIGPTTTQCASGGSADFFIFGGTPPYSILNTDPQDFSVSPMVVSSSGGKFTGSVVGGCVLEPGSPIVIRDAQGRTVTVTVANKTGTAAPPPLKVSPDAVTLSDCTSSASVTAVGGTGGYSATAGSGSIFVTQFGSTFTIQRVDQTPATTSPVSVGISDGVTTVNVTVNLDGAGAGACPAPAFAVSPTSVNLTNCTTPQNVSLSGGSGTYSLLTISNISVSASVSGSILSIVRSSPSPAFVPQPATVTVSDGSVTRSVSVTGTGTGGGICP